MMCERPWLTERGMGICRKCPQCLKASARSWKGRLAGEAFVATQTLFVTLTVSGEYEHVMNDVQLGTSFIREFRRIYGRTCKYFMVHENGSTTGRGHWHMLLFLYEPMPDDWVLNFAMENPCWKYGTTQIETLRSVAGSIGYIFKYITKDGGTRLRPSNGIGKEYLKRHAEMLARNRRPLLTEWGIKYTVPNAFKKHAGRSDGSMSGRAGKPKLWEYLLHPSHHWCEEMIRIYVAEWLRLHKDEPPTEYLAKYGGDY